MRVSGRYRRNTAAHPNQVPDDDDDDDGDDGNGLCYSVLPSFGRARRSGDEPGIIKPRTPKFRKVLFSMANKHAATRRFAPSYVRTLLEIYGDRRPASGAVKIAPPGAQDENRAGSIPALVFCTLSFLSFSRKGINKHLIPREFLMAKRVTDLRTVYLDNDALAMLFQKIAPARDDQRLCHSSETLDVVTGLRGSRSQGV